MNKVFYFIYLFKYFEHISEDKRFREICNELCFQLCTLWHGIFLCLFIINSRHNAPQQSVATASGHYLQLWHLSGIYTVTSQHTNQSKLRKLLYQKQMALCSFQVAEVRTDLGNDFKGHESIKRHLFSDRCFLFAPLLFTV